MQGANIVDPFHHRYNYERSSPRELVGFDLLLMPPRSGPHRHESFAVRKECRVHSASPLPSYPARRVESLQAGLLSPYSYTFVSILRYFDRS